MFSNISFPFLYVLIDDNRFLKSLWYNKSYYVFFRPAWYSHCFLPLLVLFNPSKNPLLKPADAAVRCHHQRLKLALLAHDKYKDIIVNSLQFMVTNKGIECFCHNE